MVVITTKVNDGYLTKLSLSQWQRNDLGPTVEMSVGGIEIEKGKETAAPFRFLFLGPDLAYL